MISVVALAAVVNAYPDAGVAELKPYTIKHCGDVMLNSVAFSADSQYLAAGSWSWFPQFKLQVFNLSGAAQPVYSLVNTSVGVVSVAYSMDGKWLATGSQGLKSDGDNITRVYAIGALGEPVLKYQLEDNAFQKTKVLFSADSKVLLSVSYQPWPASLGVLSLYSMEEGVEPKQVSTLTLPSWGINNVALSADGRWL